MQQIIHRWTGRLDLQYAIEANVSEFWCNSVIKTSINLGWRWGPTWRSYWIQTSFTSASVSKCWKRNLTSTHHQAYSDLLRSLRIMGYLSQLRHLYSASWQTWCLFHVPDECSLLLYLCVSHVSALRAELGRHTHGLSAAFLLTVLKLGSMSSVQSQRLTETPGSHVTVSSLRVQAHKCVSVCMTTLK